MTYFRITIEIQALPDRVWSVMRDVERWPEWTATVTSIRLMDHDGLNVGSRAMVRQPKLLPATWEVTELKEGSSFTWVTRSPGLQVIARHLVEANGTGSRATLSIQFSGLLGPLIARFTRALNQRYLAIEAEGLRKRSETDRQSAATG
ncbi:MAG: SRPBCC family protein [Bryobacteraceae bacterium]